MQDQLVKSQTSLEIKRTFQAPISLVYRAWTEPQMMDVWFHPNPEMVSTCSVDLRVGGRYVVQMHPTEGESYVVSGVYREIIPEQKLVFTWGWKGDEIEAETLVTVLFHAVNAKETLLTLLHERFPNEEERDSHAAGWQGVLDQLAAALK